MSSPVGTVQRNCSFSGCVTALIYVVITRIINYNGFVSVNYDMAFGDDALLLLLLSG